MGKNKILVCVESGLNDSIGGLNYIIDFCYRLKIPLENIHFYSKTYKDIIKVVDFQIINFLIEEPIIEDYDLVYNHFNGCDTEKNLGNIIHVSNFVKVRPEYKHLFSENFDKVGIHFRFMGSECRRMSAEDELVSYMVKFNKIYNKQRKYIIYSDHPIVKEIHYDNVEIVCPDVKINIKRKKENRFLNCERTILDIYSMSCCKKVYRTKGFFTSLCRIFNPMMDISYLL